MIPHKWMMPLGAVAPQSRINRKREFVKNDAIFSHRSRGAEADYADYRLLSAKEASKLLKLSVSWLAKARMRGDGPPYLQLGRAVRYSEGGFCSG